MPVVMQVIMWGMAGLVWIVVLWAALAAHGQWAAHRRSAAAMNALRVEYRDLRKPPQPERKA